jgi:nicotinate-nucleotide pyrophosphorylase (carboxylating)
VNALTPAEVTTCQRLLALALAEDLDRAGDLTSLAVIPADLRGQAVFVARAPGVVAGLPFVGLVVAAVGAGLTFEQFVQDGTRVSPGQRLGRMAGPMRALLTAERTALNFLQHLSGVATQTRRYVDAVGPLPCRILDTRKTLPGWRLLEKYAVRCGGGHNHRVGLYDGILIKDNHLAPLGRGPAAVTQAVQSAKQLLEQQARSAAPGWTRPELEVEVEDLAQLDAALAAGPDVVLLDNMSLDLMREAVRRRDAVAPGVKLEASGGVTLATLRGIAATGVDRVSVGALTHSAPALDIALDYEAS